MLESIVAKINVFICMMILLAALQTQAKDKEQDKRVYLKFENQLVEGENDKPGGDLIFNRSQATFKKLIKIRENFIPEVKNGKGDFGGQ